MCVGGGGEGGTNKNTTLNGVCLLERALPIKLLPNAT